MTLYRDPRFPSVFTENFDKLRPFDKDLGRTLADWNDILKAILERGISFQDNVDCRLISFATDAVPGTQTTVAHGLGKVPVAYIPMTKDKAADLYNTAASDKTNLYLKSDASSATITLLVF